MNWLYSNIWNSVFPICFVYLQILNTYKNHFVYYSNDPSDESFSVLFLIFLYYYNGYIKY